MSCMNQTGWTIRWADFGFILVAQSAGMCIFIVDTFILLQVFYCFKFIAFFIHGTIKFSTEIMWIQFPTGCCYKWSVKADREDGVCGRTDEPLLECPLAAEASPSGRPLTMSCALWDGNGPHNQLELRITAALWVPLQSHPPKQAAGTGSGPLRSTQLKGKEMVIKKVEKKGLMEENVPVWSARNTFPISSVSRSWLVYFWVDRPSFKSSLQQQQVVHLLWWLVTIKHSSNTYKRPFPPFSIQLRLFTFTPPSSRCRNTTVVLAGLRWCKTRRALRSIRPLSCNPAAQNSWVKPQSHSVSRVSFRSENSLTAVAGLNYDGLKEENGQTWICCKMIKAVVVYNYSKVSILKNGDSSRTNA